MRSRSTSVPQSPSKLYIRFANSAAVPFVGSRHCYVAFGLLLVLASCSATDPSSQFTARQSPLTLRGFQIQIYTTAERTAAENTADTAKQWWKKLDENKQRALFGVSELPVNIKWRQPYYRVSIGHFSSREEARAVLDIVSREFPAAFVVADAML